MENYNLKNIKSDFECNLCAELVKNRNNIVIYRGNPNSKILFIGEAPGENEDLQGKPFVGKCGIFLDKFLDKIGINCNEDICIINTIRCRPPANRDPLPDEINNCKKFVIEWIVKMNPLIIVTLGKVARDWMRNNWFLTNQEEKELCFLGGGLYWAEMNKSIKIDHRIWLPIYHPRYLMANKEEAYKAYIAIKQVYGNKEEEKHDN